MFNRKVVIDLVDGEIVFTMLQRKHYMPRVCHVLIKDEMTPQREMCACQFFIFDRLKDTIPISQTPWCTYEYALVFPAPEKNNVAHGITGYSTPCVMR